jgi:hypothetical protein
VEVGFSRVPLGANPSEIHVDALPIEMRRRIGRRVLGYMDPEFRFERKPWFGAREYSFDDTAESVRPYLHNEAEDFWTKARQS